MKGAIHDFVSSSCTSGKKGTGVESGCEPRPAPRNQSSSHEGSGLGGLLTSSPILTAARASMAVSSGSGAAVATTPEGGSPTAPSPSQDVKPSPDAAIDILSTDGAPNEMLGAPWDGPAKSPGNRTGCSLREEQEVRGDVPGGEALTVILRSPRASAGDPLLEPRDQHGWRQRVPILS